jgi:hypothetical protein
MVSPLRCFHLPLKHMAMVIPQCQESVMPKLNPCIILHERVADR